MPLLVCSATLNSASTLKFWNFCLDTRLFAGFVGFVISPSTTDQFSGRLAFWPTNASSDAVDPVDLPSKSTTGAPYVCFPLALDGGHTGGFTPIMLTVRGVGAPAGCAG